MDFLSNMDNIARYLMLGGIILLFIGGGVFVASKFGIPLESVS